MVVDADTIVDPRTVTAMRQRWRNVTNRVNSLVFFGNAPPTSLAVLTSQGPSDQTCCTKVLIIKSAVFDQQIDRLLRLRTTVALGYEAGICPHRYCIEVRAEADRNDEDAIQDRM